MALLDLRMACLDRAKQELVATADVLVAADPEVVSHAHAMVAGLPPLANCADVEALTAAVAPPSSADTEAVDAIRADLARARALLHAGRYPDAQIAVDDAERGVAEVEYGPVRIEFERVRGTLLRDLAEHAGAEAAFTEVIREGPKHRQWDLVRLAATELITLVSVDLERPAEGLRYQALAEGLAQGDPEAEARVWAAVASSHFAAGEHSEAEALFRRALARVAPESAERSYLQERLGATLLQSAGPEEAEVLLRAAIETRGQQLGLDHPKVAMGRLNLALVLQQIGRFVEAETLSRAALASLEASVPAASPILDSGLATLGRAVGGQGRYAEAEPLLQRALDRAQDRYGAEHPRVAEFANDLGSVQSRLGKHSAADSTLRIALAALEEDDPRSHMIRHNLANIALRQGAYEQAAARFREAIVVFDAAGAEAATEGAVARSGLSTALVALGRAAEATENAEAAWAVLESNPTPGLRATAAFQLARALWEAHGSRSRTDLEQRRRARKLAERAAADYAEVSAAHADDAEEVRLWLAEHR